MKKPTKRANVSQAFLKHSSVTDQTEHFLVLADGECYHLLHGAQKSPELKSGLDVDGGLLRNSARPSRLRTRLPLVRSVPCTCQFRLKIRMRDGDDGRI